ncbi:MAG: ornithine carbamoyltransferase [Actinomycetota bacterium]|nr:ornithine carbamoyltransferase [Actinomycetota bacterium]
MPKKRDLLSLLNYKQEEIYRLLSQAMEFKRRYRLSLDKQVLAGKSIALIFNKPSTRTRISFEAAITQLGGNAVYLTATDLQLGRGETIEDTGKVLSRYVDAIVIRTFAHADVEDLAAAADVPVVNALTDDHHPCQALADLMTILEKKARLAGVKLAYIGDGNNVCHSLLIGAAKMGVDFVAACPPGYEPDAGIVEAAQADPAGATVAITGDPKEAALGADIIYTDVWTSMGQEAEAKARLRDFSGFRVDRKLLSLAKPDALVMHCLPAHRGEEISAEVLDGPQSVVFDQAENRLHVQKALLAWLIGEG